MKRLLLLVLMLLLCCLGAGAEEAADLTAGCRFSCHVKKADYSLMTDGDLRTHLDLKDKKGTLEIESDSPIFGLSLMLFDQTGKPQRYELQAMDGAGDWYTVGEGGQYLAHWHSIPGGAQRLKLYPTGAERLRIDELRCYGEGDRPREAQDWHSLDKCQLMLLSTHPDDEILWFGGLLPTYAGERGLDVQVAVMVPTGGQRKLELLSAIWHCGVTAYPAFLGFVDNNGKTVQGQYERWRGKERVQRVVVRLIRQYRPEVLVTHSENGEYGHAAHKTTADAAKVCVALAADPRKFPQSAREQGTWQVKKLYLHEYAENAMECDWSVPLSAFGGKTGYQVAEEAFQYHASQVRRNWHFEVHGEHDNALFGLYFSAVGRDSGLGDMMENVE